MARCSSPPTITWLTRIGWFIIAATPMPWPLMAACPAIEDSVGIALTAAEWPGIGLAIASWLAIVVWAGMGASLMVPTAIAVPRNTQAAKQTLRMVKNPMPEAAL